VSSPYLPNDPRATAAKHTLPAHLVPERAGVVAFLSGQKRAGDWILPRLFRAVAAMGNVEIDLTNARFAPGTSHIEVRSILGNIEIFVPPYVRVECIGHGMLGNFEQKGTAQTRAPHDAPVIVVDGLAFLGNVEVKVVDPDAPGFVDRLLERFTG